MNTLFFLALCALVGCSYAAPVSDLAAIQDSHAELRDPLNDFAAQDGFSNEHKGTAKRNIDFTNRELKLQSNYDYIESMSQEEEPNHLKDANIRTIILPLVIDLNLTDSVKAKPKSVSIHKEESSLENTTTVITLVIKRKPQEENPPPVKPSEELVIDLETSKPRVELLPTGEDILDGVTKLIVKFNDERGPLKSLDSNSNK